MTDTHSHSHSHSHGHSHAHSHSGPRDYNKAFAVGVVLNLAFVAIEATYGFVANSLALIADAGHNLSDVVGLALAWAAVWLSRKKPTLRYTYGLRRSSILSALFNSVLLLVVVGGITWEAVRRFWTPAEVQTGTMMTVAFIGILINSATALLFASGRKADLNIRGAYLHMAADALVSVGVVLAGLIIQTTHLLWIDPMVSIVISLVITVGTWGLLKDSLNLAMDAVPVGVDIAGVKDYLASIAGVDEVHDLHIWAMSTTETALTVHLVMPGNFHRDEFLAKVSQDLKARFQIDHPTIQIEAGDLTSFQCTLKPDDVV
ncbi:MAG: cation transporter [Bdellovibrionaceae bacterium]|nr:cation transporter [Pseudobdellovibrionaceae bacterium]